MTLLFSWSRTNLISKRCFGDNSRPKDLTNMEAQRLWDHS